MVEIPDEVRLGPFPGGMNNRMPDHALPDGTVRNLVNTNVDNGGIISRRKGLEKVYSSVGCQDGYDSPIGEFFREGSNIMLLNTDNTATRIFGGVVGDRCAFEYHNDIVYFSDGIITKKIYPDFTVTNWGMSVPNPPIIYGSSGTYGIGTYAACCTFVDAYGNESGSSDEVSLTLGTTGGIQFINIPTSSDPQVIGVRLYLTTPNSSIFHLIADLVIGTATYSQTIGTYDDGPVLETQFMSPPSAGTLIREFKGIIYIADALGTVWHTNPMSNDLVMMTENFFQFPKPVTLMEPVADGMYFANGKVTEFYAGSGPESFTVRQILDYGAALGTGKEYDDTTRIWWSHKGVIKGGPGGQISNIQEKNVAADYAESGSSVVREEDGIKQFISSLVDPTTSNLVAKDFFDAEIIRKT